MLVNAEITGKDEGGVQAEVNYFFRFASTFLLARVIVPPAFSIFSLAEALMLSTSR